MTWGRYAMKNIPTVGFQNDGLASSSRIHLQRSATNSSLVNAVPPIVHDVLNSSGQPLERNTREFMESRFGHDFSGVRVHTDSRAAESARAVNALAYTVGQDVVFGREQYIPGNMTGRKLIAHELTHVVQQRKSLRSSSLLIDSSTSSAEKEAATVASAFTTQSAHPPISSYLTPTLARSTDEQLGSAEHSPAIRSSKHSVTSLEAQKEEGDTNQSSAAIFPICFAPSVFFTPLVAAGFGLLAEKMIEKDYCDQMGCKAGENYFDPSLGGFDKRYASFIIQNNPLLTRSKRAILRISPMRRPDILTHAPSRQEYYEIKPNSISGLISGLEKLIEIKAIYHFFSLPYIAGTGYTPTSKIPLISFAVGNTPVEAFIGVHRSRAGLIRYDLCLRTNWAKVALAAAIAALIILLIILIGSETGIPLPNPGKKPPAPSPELPTPMPNPIPRVPRRRIPIPTPTSASGITVQPRPYVGEVGRDFNFEYISGLPDNPIIGQTYSITISHMIHRIVFTSIIPFIVLRIENKVVQLVSTNNIPLDIAPVGEQPQVIPARTPAHISLQQLAGDSTT
jgi:Domain of unknown function (DUF4157)